MYSWMHASWDTVRVQTFFFLTLNFSFLGWGYSMRRSEGNLLQLTLYFLHVRPGGINTGCWIEQQALLPTELSCQLPVQIFFKFLKIMFVYIGGCGYGVCVYRLCARTCSGQKRCQILLEPELQAVVSRSLWVLGTEPQSSERAVIYAQLMSHLSPNMDVLKRLWNKHFCRKECKSRGKKYSEVLETSPVRSWRTRVGLMVLKPQQMK